RIRARERDPLVGQDVEDRRPQRLVRDLDEPALLTADRFRRIELATDPAAERDRDREPRERDPHQSFANMRFTCEKVDACAVATGAFAARGRAAARRSASCMRSSESGWLEKKRS